MSGTACWLGEWNPHLVLPLGEALVAAAVESRHEEQEGCHADDSDDQGRAEPVLGLLWWSLTLEPYVIDSHLARKENVMW